MEFVKCLGHPEEFYNLLRFQMGGRRKVIPKMDQMPFHVTSDPPSTIFSGTV
ncbi:hypothetical protein FD754_003272 [Muntiacus muntjak]|uniref:FDFT1 n=1 Tax=Muntiacus muntjak TaxID=9888 RepID=A0A5N3WFR6_MUNMU|nr:hypothetical protein FD754_003272 [Muntiacus muntjak]